MPIACGCSRDKWTKRYARNENKRRVAPVGIWWRFPRRCAKIPTSKQNGGMTFGFRPMISQCVQTPAKIARSIRPTIVRTAQGNGGRSNRASVLQEGRKSANSHVRSEAISGKPFMSQPTMRIGEGPALAAVLRATTLESSMAAGAHDAVVVGAGAAGGL